MDGWINDWMEGCVTECCYSFVETFFRCLMLFSCEIRPVFSDCYLTSEPLHVFKWVNLFTDVCKTYVNQLICHSESNRVVVWFSHYDSGAHMWLRERCRYDTPVRKKSKDMWI